MTELPLFILYGSATGNAEHIAKDLASTYESKLPEPFTKIICCEGNEFKKKCLPIWSQEAEQKYGVVVVMSTTGNGDAPENGSRFLRYLKRKTTIEAKPLQNVAYGVLALGDSNYDQFCASGVLVDKKFQECGGERVRSVAKADEATGLEEVVEEFIANIIPLLAKTCSTGPSESTTPTKGGPRMDGVKCDIHKKKKIDRVNSDEHQNEPKANVQPRPDKLRNKFTGETIPPSSMKRHEASNEPPQKEKTIKNYTSPSTDLLSNRGVTLVRQLLATLNSQHTNDTEIEIPEANPIFLPPLGSNLSSCKLVDVGYTERQKSGNDIPSSEMEHMTISSASSSNIHYTLNHPYESTILSANYLTKTPLNGVTKASKTLSNNISETAGVMNHHQELDLAMRCLEESFPLIESPVDSPVENNCIERNGKRVVEMTLSLPNDFTLEYQPGDCIGLVASNSFHATEFVLSLLQENHGIKRSQLVSINTKEPTTVEDMIRNHIDLCSTIKNKKILVKLAQHAADKEEANALNLLASSDPIGQEIFRMLVDEQCLTPVHILKLFPSCQAIPINELLGSLPSIPPRYYSICSSPLREEEHTSLTIAFSVVNYMTPQLNIKSKPRRRVGGLVTSYLEALCAPLIGSGAIDVSFSTPKVKIFPKPSVDFRLPSNILTPMILIGPGTGIAPFIGFLEHRQAQINPKRDTIATKSISEGTWRGGFEILEEEETSTTKESDCQPNSPNKVSKRIGSIDVYFGCRHENHDWLYEKKMKKFKEQNIISDLNVAFSRDEKNKYYVQDRITQNVDRVVDMVIHKNASIYICGDGNAMARDVQDAIQFALKNHNGDEDISIQTLKSENRLLLDIWS